MNYSKVPLSIDDQIRLLRSRGLKIANEPLTKHYLTNISYYRLSAYMKSFQKYNDKAHRFVPWATFDRIVDLYTFDRDLRLILLDAIERIEVAFRCSFIYEYSMRHGNNWYEDPGHFNRGHSKSMATIQGEIDRSKEVFIKHYKSTYTNPVNPPAFMTLEVLSFGQLSILYKNTVASDAKKAVARHFGVSYKVLESWVEHLVYVRNMCAHHSRIWNRDFLIAKPTIPTTTSYPWISMPASKNDKIYTTVTIIVYILKQINPTSSFTGRLKALLRRHPLLNTETMGFPKNWWADPFWSVVYIPLSQLVRINYFKVRSIIYKTNIMSLKSGIIQH